MCHRSPPDYDSIQKIYYMQNIQSNIHYRNYITYRIYKLSGDLKSNIKKQILLFLKRQDKNSLIFKQ